MAAEKPTKLPIQQLQEIGNKYKFLTRENLGIYGLLYKPYKDGRETELVMQVMPDMPEEHKENLKQAISEIEVQLWEAEAPIPYGENSTPAIALKSGIVYEVPSHTLITAANS